MAPSYDTDLPRTIIDLATRIHTELGPGLSEEVYEQCLCHELEETGLVFARQVELQARYNGALLGLAFRADIIVREEVLLQIEAVEEIMPVHEAELLTCLKFSGCHVGLLLNFNTVSLQDGIRRLDL